MRRSTLAFVGRLTITALAAYVLAELLLPAVAAPLLAPLTALLVVQVSTYRTMRQALDRVISVVVGVLLAIGFAMVFGFSWLSLTAAIALALAVGRMLKLGDNLLEVPISAMLILQVGPSAAATDRVVETFIGAGVGLLAGLVLSPARVRPAAQALDELGRRMAELEEDMADGLREEPDPAAVRRWLDRASEFGKELRRVEAEMVAAEESIRMKPRSRSAEPVGPALRSAQETLERNAVTLRGLARCIADRTGLYVNDRGGLGEQMWEADVREHLAATLREIAKATRAYAESGLTTGLVDAASIRPDIDRAVGRGRAEREDLGRLLREDPGHWPLHGELLVHLDRLLDGLRDGKAPIVLRQQGFAGGFTAWTGRTRSAPRVRQDRPRSPRPARRNRVRVDFPVTTELPSRSPQARRDV